MSTAGINPVGVILAGGKSTRMGRDKAGLRIQGETLLQRARNTLLAAGCSDVILSGHDRPEWDWQVVHDLLPNSGPASGIASSIIWAHKNELDAATLVFVPVDTPLLTPDILRSIIELADREKGCSIENSPLPVAIKVSEASVNLSQMISSEIKTGTPWPVKRLLELLPASYISINNAHRLQLANINTPQEWEELSRELENCT